MKKLCKLFITIAFLLIHLKSLAQIGIGTTEVHQSALLEIKSSSKGFLLPRLTIQERTNIQNPVEGLMIYCRDYCETGSLNIFSQGIWRNIASGCTHIDIDNDGLINTKDLDDDNDGILDKDEHQSGLLSYDYHTITSAMTSLDDFPTTPPVNSGITTSFNVDSIGQANGSTDYFSLRFKGYIYINETDEYTFTLNSDDGSRLFIDDEEIINNDGARPAVSIDANKELPKGLHKIEIIYFEYHSQLILEFFYSSSTITKRYVPFSILFPLNDIDNDGLANHLDLDTDGDGCWDAIEGDGNLTEANLNSDNSLSGNINENGLPISANSGQNIGNSQNSLISSCDPKASCLEIFNSGITTDGIYTIDPDGSGANPPIDAYCYMSGEGGGWTLLFRHHTDGGLFANDTEADNFNENNPGITTNKYSILNKMDDFKRNNKYEFRLFYPSLNKRNIWRQEYDPRSGTSTIHPALGYEPITIEMNENSWGGLESHSGGSEETFLDGSVSSNAWYYSIGSNVLWNGGFPANNISVNEVLLFIR